MVDDDDDDSGFIFTFVMSTKLDGVVRPVVEGELMVLMEVNVEEELGVMDDDAASNCFGYSRCFQSALTKEKSRNSS